MKKWNATDYIGTRYDNYYILYTQTRDSDVLDQSNFRSIIKHLDSNPNIKYEIIRSSHWMCGWIEQIIIDESDTTSVQFGESIEEELKGYSIFDEDDYSQMESEKVDACVDMIRKEINNLDPEEDLKGWEPVTKNMDDEQIRDIAYERGWGLQ